MRDGNGHTFGAINGRATTYGNQAIASLRFVNLTCGSDRCLSGVRRRLVKNSDLNARQCVQSFLQDASSFDALVGDDEGFVDTNALALLF